MINATIIRNLKNAYYVNQIGDKKYNGPEYVTDYETVGVIDRGIKARPVDFYTFLAREEIVLLDLAELS